MEEIQKSTKSVATRHPTGKPNSSLCGSSFRNVKQHLFHPPAARQVVFRMLCHVNAVGGVIGNSGSIIKRLESLSGSKIQFEEGQPNCIYRVINIVGDAAVEKKISVEGCEDENPIDVSSAQDGLIRVFERILEVEGNVENNENNNKHHRNDFTSCRLLVPLGQVGVVIGKGGKIVVSIQKITGAKIKVFKNDQTPACAGGEGELIQIKGQAMVVKKALLAVSNCLQDQVLDGGASGSKSSHGLLQSSNADFNSSTRLNLQSFSGNAVRHHSVSQSLTQDFERTNNIEDESSRRKVIFKYLCSNRIAGGVIGKGADIVKSLEKETGASINFASPVSGSKFRLVIISSLESSKQLHSPTQNALLRVFARCMEVGLDQGLISSIGNEKSVTARLVVASTQVAFFLNEDGKVASDISLATSFEIKSEGADLQCYAGENDRVVQITGEYDKVRSALFLMTGKLRENVFSGMGHQRADLSHGSNLAWTKSTPKGKSSSTYSTEVRSEQKKIDKRRSLPRPADSVGGSPTPPSIPRHESLVTKIPKELSEVVLIPVKELGRVYGENYSNLNRLIEISGAAVTVQDPSPGDYYGKVVISGMPEQIQIAQSLLQAFILT